MAKRNILVTGATGHQGQALIRALSEATPGDADFHCLALTRNVASPAAQHLASAHAALLTLVQGDLGTPESVRTIFEDAKQGGAPIWGVFCVLAYPGLGANADGEREQGKALADVALEYGVSSFVYSSSERAGENYDDTALDESHRAKAAVERHIKELGTKGLPWTILRPGFFMENYDGFLGSITVGILKRGLKPTTTNHMVAVDDIGIVAAAVFKNPDKFASQILVISGEVTTMSEQEEAYKKATGRALPSIPGLFAGALIALNTHARGLLADLERKHEARETGLCPEFQDQAAAAKLAHPEMMTLQAWAERRGGQSGEQKGNWNEVSLFRLITGRL
ncbi:hypothetical protein GGX14DRAFT_361153 [Mycena pura]|uniref:NmrA-like domain-containing protein n=1 Tax=Mycena pura TaxID=153505 RepID=A0AAD6VHR0_9AGAR|nr:hypothetical protein GGX14DRAFT_361153 [Mycena pura]